MMRDVDELIDEALDAEERELLNRIGEEPGWFSQAFSIFTGRIGWVHIVTMIVQTVLFLVGVWTAWHFFNAGDALTALRWGLPATALILSALMMKLALMPAIHANRLLRELKRIELQLARSARP